MAGRSSKIGPYDTEGILILLPENPAFFACPAASRGAGKAGLRPGVPEPFWTTASAHYRARPDRRQPRRAAVTGLPPHRGAVSDRPRRTGCPDYL